MPVPIAVMIVRISSFDRILSSRAFSHVQDLAAQRQDRLEVAVAALLGGATGRVTLDQVQLAHLRDRPSNSRPACRAARRPRAPLLRRTSSRALRAASRARAALQGLVDDGARHARVLIEERSQQLRSPRPSRRPRPRSCPAWSWSALRTAASCTLTDSTAVSPSRTSSPGSVEFFLLEGAVLLRVVVERARQRGLEAGEVRAAFVRVDVVDEGERVLVVAVVVLDAPARSRLRPSRGLERRSASGCSVLRVPTHELDELRDAALVEVRLFALCRPSRSSVSVIVRPLFRNASSRRRFESDVEIEARLGEDLGVGLERDRRAGVLGLADRFELGLGVAALERLW